MIGKISKQLTLLSLSLLLFATSCEKRTYQTIEELDAENISLYIAKNNLSVQRYKNTGLYYQIITPGTGSDLRFEKIYPIVFTMKSLDGVYISNDTLKSSNRYMDFLGYFPFGASQAGQQNSPVERQDDLKYVVKEILGKANGQIRILVPSHLTAWGRNGNRYLGIPANASIDYVISIYDDLEDYEDKVIQGAIVRAGFSVNEFTKSPEGIYYKIISQGTGATIYSSSSVKAKYTLRNTNGEVVENATEDSTQFNLGGGVISAWTKIIPKINVGGKVRFFTPSSQAYGPVGNETIVPFMSLDFEVEIVE